MKIKVKCTAPRTYITTYLKVEEIVGRFYEQELQKTKQLRLELKR